MSNASGMRAWTLVLFLGVAASLASCGGESGKFRLEGRLRNMNQAEFWVYSPDGTIDGVDTIKVRNGRFAYELDLMDEGTLVVIFPNYSEQPVFAASGSVVSVKGDASHLKEMVIEGTTDNEDMTTLRLKLNDLTPPEIPAAVREYIEEHPHSPASIYLLQRYFVLSPEPDYVEGKRLADLLLRENPDNGQLMRLSKQLAALQGAMTKGVLQPFTVNDVNGRRVTEGDLRGTVNIVYTWASWSYSSQALHNRVVMLKRRYGDKMGALGICLDADAKRCRERLRRDSVRWATVCDGQAWDTPLLAKMSLADVPANMLADKNGRVIARNLTAEELEQRVVQMLK